MSFKPNRKRRPHQGWYQLKNPGKFRAPIDNTMKSFNDGCVLFKSGLELKSIKYCDLNPKILEWSLEPFFIPYMSPVDMRMHRYFPDLWIKFEGDLIIVVEVKSSSETKMPRKNDKQYAKKLQTYLINQAKWQAAAAFCKQRNVHFQILTDKTLGA